MTIRINRFQWEITVILLWFGKRSSNLETLKIVFWWLHTWRLYRAFNQAMESSHKGLHAFYSFNIPILSFLIFVCGQSWVIVSLQFPCVSKDRENEHMRVTYTTCTCTYCMYTYSYVILFAHQHNVKETYWFFLLKLTFHGKPAPNYAFIHFLYTNWLRWTSQVTTYIRFHRPKHIKHKHFNVGRLAFRSKCSFIG